MKIIDSHVHFEDKDHSLSVREEYVAEYGGEKWDLLQKMNGYQKEKWQKAWGFPKPLPPHGDYRVIADQWIAEMDANNVEMMVFVTGGTNERLSDVVKLYPDRFVGYAHHDPCAPDAAERLEEAITKQGLRGYKLLGPRMNKAIDDPALRPVWEVAEKHEIPVLIHFGILGAAGGIAHHVNINPIILHDVARAYPKIPFIVPHFGCSYPKDLLFLAWACPNVYVDTSGSNQWVNWMDYPLTLKDLFAKFRQQLGAGRILFGTDSMWFPRGFVKEYYFEQMKCCVELGFSDGEIEQIYRTNMLDLLNMR